MIELKKMSEVKKVKWTELSTEDQDYMLDTKKFIDRSFCFSNQIASILVTETNDIAGWNHPPIFTCDKLYGTEEGKCPRHLAGATPGTGEKMEMCSAVHAEVDVILKAALHGVATMNGVLYCWCGIPCKDCMKEIITAGIKKIVCLDDDKFNRAQPTVYNFEFAKKLAELSGIEILMIEMSSIPE